MTAIAGLIGDSHGAALSVAGALAVADHRQGEIATARVGDVEIGAMGPEARSRCGASERWAVALAGSLYRTSDGEATDAVASLLAALNRSGEAALRDLDGEFAGIATDGTSLFAFRDHLGSRPLFVGSTGSRAVVATEPKQVVAGLGRSRQPDIDGLVATYFSQWEPPDDVPSVVAGVNRIPRRSVTRVTASATTHRGWTWDPGTAETSTLTVDEAIETGWKVVESAVQRALTPATAVSLSGGIDSTLIAAAGAPAFADAFGKGLPAVTATYPHAPSVDESAYVNKTAAFLGLDVHEFPSSRDRLAGLEAWVDRFDGPTHGLAVGPMAEMNEVASAQGISRLLGGEMAELVYDLREYALARILWRGNWAVARQHVRHMRSRGVPRAAIARMIGSGLLPGSALALYQRRFRTQPELPAWLDESFMPGLQRNWSLEQPARWRWTRIQEFFPSGPTYPGVELASIMGDVAGVHTERPLAAPPVWEFFLSLPPEVKFPDGWTKSLVRRMLDQRAPAEVVWRTDKTVFDADTKHRSGYETLRSLVSTDFRLPGVDYAILDDRLGAGDLNTWELSMVRNLASIHVFVGLCS